MLFTVVGSARSHTPMIRLDMSSASRPLYVQITLTIGILICGKMSVGVVTIEATPKIAICSATMTNVYGLFRCKANDPHKGPSPAGYLGLLQISETTSSAHVLSAHVVKATLRRVTVTGVPAP